MATEDTCTLVPYFKIHDGQIDAFKQLCGEFIKVTNTEPKCLIYTFSFDGDLACCLEAYQGAEGVLAHVQNVDALFGELLKIADLARIEVHGPEQELAKLREPMADLNPQFFVYELGFRR
jgi:quinol monooxygenase YgiN